MEVLEAALRYLELGWSVLPVTGKAPSMSEGTPFRWQAYQRLRPTSANVTSWHERGMLAGVGVISGAVSRNLVVIDLDGDEAVRTFAERYANDEILDTWTIRSGSGHGMHIYLYVRNLPPTTRVSKSTIGGVEVRANGCYVVAPPSIHPSGNPYTVYHRAPVRTVNDLSYVVEWVKSLMKEKHGGDMPPVSGKVNNTSAWGWAALMGECERVRNAMSHRNDTLYIAALKCGSLIAAGVLDRDTAARHLLDAAAGLSADDGEIASQRTIQSGINTGLRSKRTVKAS